MRKKIVRRNPLKDESCFVGSVALWLTGDIPAELRDELETLFESDYGGLVNAGNRYMRRTIKAIKHGYMTMDGFGLRDAKCFSKLLNCDKLDASLRTELSQLINGLMKERVISADGERMAQRILTQEAGWDGKFPIPVQWNGNAKASDMESVKLVHASGDDKCFWVKDAASAVILLFLGHALETAPEVLAKRVTFKG